MPDITYTATTTTTADWDFNYPIEIAELQSYTATKTMNNEDQFEDLMEYIPDSLAQMLNLDGRSFGIIQKFLLPKSSFILTTNEDRIEGEGYCNAIDQGT